MVNDRLCAHRKLEKKKMEAENAQLEDKVKEEVDEEVEGEVDEA